MSADVILGHDFLFDNFVVNAADGSLSFHGQDISIPPKEFQVLIALLEGRGNLVFKNFIIDKVWGDTLVGDESLTRCIYSLRRLLRESKNNKFIETVYGKGYRFCKPITLVPRKRQDPRDCTLAVFPFRGTDRAEAMLLQSRLLDFCTQARLPGLAIVPAMLTRELTGLDEILVVCRQLGIDCYLSGEFALVGGDRMLSVELIDAESQRLLFRDTLCLEGGETGNGPLQRMGSGVLEHLPLQLPELPREAPGEIMLSHVMARRCLRRRAHGDVNLAQQYLQMGLLQDPNHVPSLVSMAEVQLAHAMQGGIWPLRAQAGASQLLEKAMNIAPGHVLALTIMAWQLSLSGDASALASSLFLRAQAASGASAELYLYHGLHLCMQGELDQALQHLDFCLAHDEDLEYARVFRLWVLLAQERHAEVAAGVLSERGLAEPAPLYYSVLALGLAEAGDAERAALYANMALESAPASLPERILHATVRVHGGMPAAAQDMLTRWCGEAQARYRCPGLLANLALQLGDDDRTRALVQLACEQRCVWWPLVRVLPRMAAFLSRQPRLECYG